LPCLYLDLAIAVATGEQLGHRSQDLTTGIQFNVILGDQKGIANIDIAFICLKLNVIGRNEYDACQKNVMIRLQFDIVLCIDNESADARDVQGRFDFHVVNRHHPATTQQYVAIFRFQFDIVIDRSQIRVHDQIALGLKVNLIRHDRTVDYQPRTINYRRVAPFRLVRLEMAILELAVRHRPWHRTSRHC